MKLITALFAIVLPLHAAEQVFFAFDDQNIAWQHNLKLTLETVQKHPANPVLRSGPPGSPDHGHAILYGTVMKQGDTFRMWYLGMHETENKSGQAPGWWRPMCYAESKDGITWTKPELGLVEFNGSRKNNICLIEGDPHSMTRVNDFLSVLYEPEDPDPAKRYKCAYIAHMPFDEVKGGRSKIGPNERRWAAFVTATSADGLKWKCVGDRPANAGGERFEVSSLYRFGDFYCSTGQLISPWSWRADGSDIGRDVLAYRSPDFVTWSKAKALAFARIDQLTTPPIKGRQCHMGAGLWNRGNVMIGLHGMWQDAEQPPPKGENWNYGVRIDLGLVISNDGVHFREPVSGHQIIPRGKEGEWDGIALLQGHAFVNEGDKTMIWYSHWDTGGKLKNMNIGLATLRRDGFGALSRKVSEEEGHFITSAFTAKEIALNVDGLTAESPIHVQLLDHLDHPLEGFEIDLTTNGLKVPLKWSKPLPSGQKIALRVNYPANSAAKIYAVYFND
ncbi:hypothetical protein [Prosthecobacter sp.]|uniref:hypothetical protein n=1 Tax=Prosthecobacter sp. TaxID=1965333 RepID=UPI001D9983B9|nr:hypothetical protein [Prosthecobacter sp.]MCB1276593.1 hypothetical protein [Prosthecobacter sp.]